MAALSSTALSACLNRALALCWRSLPFPTSQEAHMQLNIIPFPHRKTIIAKSDWGVKKLADVLRRRNF